MQVRSVRQGEGATHIPTRTPHNREESLKSHHEQKKSHRKQFLLYHCNYTEFKHWEREPSGLQSVQDVARTLLSGVGGAPTKCPTGPPKRSLGLGVDYTAEFTVWTFIKWIRPQKVFKVFRKAKTRVKPVEAKEGMRAGSHEDRSTEKGPASSLGKRAGNFYLSPRPLHPQPWGCWLSPLELPADGKHTLSSSWELKDFMVRVSPKPSIFLSDAGKVYTVEVPFMLCTKACGFFLSMLKRGLSSV